MSVRFYGNTYWDAEIQVDLQTLGKGKGKVDVPLRLTVAGFACNAARAVAEMDWNGEIGVVTTCAPADLQRLKFALPAQAQLDAILSEDDPALLPDISVILNPASDCRILRDPGPADDPGWTVESLASETFATQLHVLGRVPVAFAASVLQHTQKQGKRFAWCGGDALPLALEEACDALCVNTAEAAAMLGVSAASATTLELATALAKRASRSGAMRLVTGRGLQPTTVAVRTSEDEIRTYQSQPAAIAKEKIVGFLGVGDCFAANFLVKTFFNRDGSLRASPEVEAGLQAAQEAATHFLTHERPR